MAPRAYWKGFLRLSLVSCPIQLFPATSEREKVSFNQINKETGNRIRYRKVDEDTGEEVESENIVKGFQVSKGQYVEVDDDELETIALESTRQSRSMNLYPSPRSTTSITFVRTILRPMAKWGRTLLSSSVTSSKR